MKGIGLLVDDVPGLSGKEVEFHDAEALMPTVDLLVAYVPPIAGPAQARAAKVDQSSFWFPVLPPGDIEPVQFVDGELVSGEGISAGVQFGPASLLRG